MKYSQGEEIINRLYWWLNLWNHVSIIFQTWGTRNWYNDIYKGWYYYEGLISYCWYICTRLRAQEVDPCFAVLQMTSLCLGSRLKFFRSGSLYFCVVFCDLYFSQAVLIVVRLSWNTLLIPSFLATYLDLLLSFDLDLTFSLIIWAFDLSMWTIPDLALSSIFLKIFCWGKEYTMNITIITSETGRKAHLYEEENTIVWFI